MGAEIPDVVGLPLAEALPRLRAYRFTLSYTAPARPRGTPGAVRVIAQRLLSEATAGPAAHAAGPVVRLVCAREYWDSGPRAPAPEDGSTGHA